MPDAQRQRLSIKKGQNMPDAQRQHLYIKLWGGLRGFVPKHALLNDALPMLFS